VTTLDAVLQRLATDLNDIGVRWALIGGLAVSARAEPRTTRDVDVVVAAEGDHEAEAAVLGLRQRDYQDAGQMLEHAVTGRLATMRMTSPVADAVVDLMFASTGIEGEIALAATPVEVLPGVVVPVASVAHLLAMKVLAGRLQDQADFASLLRHASASDLAAASRALHLMTGRGTNRQKNLLHEFDRLVDESRRRG
jgi:hypothetical protein